MNFKGMYARLALKKEPVNVAVPRLNEVTLALHRMGEFEDARAVAAQASFDYVDCGVVRCDGSHGFGSLHSFRSGYRRSSNPILERGWLRVGFSGPWLQEFGGVS